MQVKIGNAFEQGIDDQIPVGLRYSSRSISALGINALTRSISALGISALTEAISALTQSSTCILSSTCINVLDLASICPSTKHS